MAPAKGPLHQRAGADDEPARKSDYAASKRIAAAHDAEQGEAIKAQMRADGLDPATGQPINKSSSSRSSSSGSARAAAPKPFFVPAPVHQAVTSSPGGTVAGAMLGALAFFTGRAFIEGGWSGVRAFYAAKFLNRTSAAPNPVPQTVQTQTTLPVNNAAGGAAAASSPSTSSGSAQGGGQTPAGNTSQGTRLKAGL